MPTQSTMVDRVDLQASSHVQRPLLVDLEEIAKGAPVLLVDDGIVENKAGPVVGMQAR